MPAGQPSLGARTGVVTTFDDDRGLGEITADDGSLHRFHCTAIADGTRTIAEGTKVRYDLIAGRQGHWEAWTIEKH